MAHFEIRNLTFAYPASGERHALEDVSLSVKKGEYVVLCGTSGSGKTTLLRHFKSVLTPHGQRKGQILMNGLELEKVGAREQSGKIGYVMQSPEDQIVTDKVWHELAFGLESLGCDQKLMRERVAEMACYFGIQNWFHEDTSKLSGGQKQLLNLASIMVMQPEILILDEPTSQLDPIAASDFLNTISKINRELGTTIVISEHRLEEIFPVADRVVVMDQGRIIVNDTPRKVGELLWREDNDLFAAMPVPMRVFYGVGEKGESPVTVREGRNWLMDAFPEPPKKIALPEPVREDEEIALSMKELWFRYEREGDDILRGLSAEIPAGSLYVIVGGNGAGKSTLLKAICGICRPYRGKLKIFGKPIQKYKGEELFRGCVAMLPQDPKNLFVKKTVREELWEMCADEGKIAEAAALCRIEPLLEQHPYDLSGGEQQRAALAKVLLTQPRLLLLDEPTKGMDSLFKKVFAGILARLKERGTTIVMVSHDVEFCAGCADWVSMFFDGQILATDRPRRFFGSNCFYTTSASRMSRGIFENAVTSEDVTALYRANMEE